MTERFAELLEATGRRHVVLRGDLDERVAAALAAIDELLAEGWDLAAPAPAAAALVDLPLAALPVGRPEVLLQDLAGGVAGELRRRSRRSWAP